MEQRRNPLKLPPVIKHVFQYLDNNNVKELRLVSKEWASVGLDVLFTRSPIIFKSERNIRRFIFRFRRFSKTPSYEMIPFRKFTFLGEEDELWSVDKLEDFIKKQGKYITELKFKELQLGDNSSNEVLESWDISSWISNCTMKKQLKPKCNSKLSISCEDWKSTTIHVDLTALDGIKELSLKNVTVHLQEGVRICPTKMKFSAVTFMEGENELSYICLNDILDFSNLKYLSFSIDEDAMEDKELSLELLGDGKLEHLKLINVELANFTSCRWEVNKLTACNMALTKETQMQIKHLSLVCSHMNSDISNVPMHVEKLSFEDIDEEIFYENEQGVFPNIKFLHLNFDDRSLPLFLQNFKFPNLTHLSLESWDNANLNLALVPKSVKVLSLTKMKIINAGNEHLSLDTFIIRLAKPLKKGEFCVPGFQTKELVLDFSLKHSYQDLEVIVKPVEAAVDILQHQNACRRNCVQRFYVGPFPWQLRQFWLSPLRFYANQEAKYYRLEKEKGKDIEWKAIERKEFYSRVDMNEIYDQMK